MHNPVQSERIAQIDATEEVPATSQQSAVEDAGRVSVRVRADRPQGFIRVSELHTRATSNRLRALVERDEERVDGLDEWSSSTEAGLTCHQRF